ncbi:spore coat protein [Ornithinibacillus halophilus]|uniref:Spore coat protein F/similar to spore coat protein n=1 Tax=Ornithinibacillus halophilus TaxID=930117 RepID=A0A1M5F3W6_9BACI|nr:spore coat protein [Ornithinibacillus halophilus]SHF86217.1 spore coat protein F/similar to spore coat protein [Ornithinibacillus halophilus]
MANKELSFTDQAIASDMLFESKAAIKDIATALTETTSSEIRTFLKKELKSAIKQHGQIYNYLHEKGIYDAYNVQAQISNDVDYGNEALKQ